jgi:hypothetical protein
MAPKVTSSSNRSKRSTSKPVTKGQNPQRANRQAVSQAKVTSASNGKPTGAAASRVTMGKGMAPMAKAATTLGTIRSMMTPAGAAAAVSAPRPLAAGTMTAAQSGRAPSRFANARDMAMKKASAIKGSPVVGPKKSTAQQFDSAFAAARKAGKAAFTFKGKKYNTKTK